MDDAGTKRQEILDAERVRTRQNIAAAVALIVLMCAAGWTVVHLRESSQLEACVEAGYRACSTRSP